MQYLKYRIRTKLLRLFGPTKPAEFAGDDFDWRAYSAHYAEELTEVEQDHTTRLSPQDYMFTEGRLTQQSSALPLHPNHRLLYETLLQLRPASVLEMGCGGGRPPLQPGRPRAPDSRRRGGPFARTTGPAEAPLPKSLGGGLGRGHHAPAARRAASRGHRLYPGGHYAHPDGGPSPDGARQCVPGCDKASGLDGELATASLSQ